MKRSQVFRLPDGNIVDLSPWAEGKDALVLVSGAWLPFDSTSMSVNFEGLFEGVRLSTEEVAKLGILKK